MGAGISKQAGVQAASAAARKYPSTPSASANAAAKPPTDLHRPGPTVKPPAHASETRDEGIEVTFCPVVERLIDGQAVSLDASDPDFARSLRQLGAVHHPIQGARQPTRQQSTDGTFLPDPRKNPAVVLLQARQRIQEAAEAEFLAAGRSGHQGRRFLDVSTIRQALVLRDQGVKAVDIESRLDLKRGILDRLGRPGLVAAAGSPDS